MRYGTVILACAAFIASGASAKPAPAGDDVFRISVQSGSTGPVIDRHIFGQFSEHLGRGIYDGIWVGTDSPVRNVRGIRTDVVDALKELHVPVIRWPGGCFADAYHWRNGVGPTALRPVTLNPDWGGVSESNAFGTAEFMDFAQQIGADAYLSLNVGSGTVEEAANWLEYLTATSSTLAKERARNGHPEPYAVPYVGIGNESWGCGGSMTPEFYVSQLKRFSHFARNFNAPHAMQRIAVGPDGMDTSYTDAVMSAWQKKTWAWDIEGISLHAYTLGVWPPSYRSIAFDEAEYAALLADTLKMNEILSTQIAVMDRYDPERKVGLIVDEWGSWLAPLPGTHKDFLEQQNSQRDAMIAALNLNIFARHASRVRMANIAQMVNVLQAMLLTRGPQLVRTPTYHVFRMYVPFQDATLLQVDYDAGRYHHGAHELPRIDVLAARDRNGATWLSLVNVDAQQSTRIELPTTALRASGETLQSIAVDSINTFDAPLTVTPTAVVWPGRHGVIGAVLPPHSITVVRLEETHH